MTDTLTYRIVVTRRLSAEERAAYPASLFTPHTIGVLTEDAATFDAAKSRTAEIAARYPTPDFIVCVEIYPGPSIKLAEEMALIPDEQGLRDIREGRPVSFFGRAA